MGSTASFSLFDAVGKEPLLTHDEEIKLSKRIEKGDKAARERMIRANLRLAMSVAKKYANRGVDIDDLMQESVLGLTQAVDRFDWSKGFRFSTYAYWWIQQAVRQCVAENSGPINLPSNTFGRLYKISKFEKEFEARNGRRPSEEEVAESFGTTVDTLRSMRQSASTPVALDKSDPSDDRASRPLRDCLVSEEKTADVLIDELRLTKAVKETLSKLTEREKMIIMMRFGINDLEENNGNA